MWNKKILAYLFFWGLISHSLTAQCSITRNVSIADNDTTVFSIVVDGLLVDSLQHPGQGLCGIRIDFRHEFIGDISMHLISPSGQTVHLVGPAVPVSGNTSFTRWNVFFIPCGSEPIPDPGFAPVWDNLQPWGLFGNYSGQYHPFSGCLEDFSQGPVNGTWTLFIEDVSQFGSGRIQGVQLVFCQDEGVECGECQLDPGDLTADSIEMCSNSSLFTLEDFTESFSNFPKDTARYKYQWALFRDTIWIDRFDQEALFGLEVGTHRLCNIQFAHAESQNLPQLPLDVDINEANALFQNNHQCVAISDSCVHIIVYPSTDTIYADTVLCENQQIHVHGVFIDSPGMYTLNIPGQVCDTILVLNVEGLNLMAGIESNADTISCSTPVITLTGYADDQNGQTYSYAWFTDDGHILWTGIDSVIQVDAPGLYHVIVFSHACTDTFTKEIFSNQDFPTLEILGVDTLTCFQDTIILSVQSNVMPDTLFWNSTQPFTVQGDSILIYLPGEYEVTLISDQNCVVRETIEIPSLQDFPAIELKTDTLRCLVDTVQLFLLPSENGNYIYRWRNVLPEDETVMNPRVVNPGYSYVEIFDLSTGCQFTDSLYVEDRRVYPQISVSVLPLTCERDTVMPHLEVDIIDVSYQWEGPGIQSSDSLIKIHEPGLYYITVTTLEGCFSTTSFTAFSDTVEANITLLADSLSCLNDSVAIFISSDKLLTETKWLNQDGQLISLEYQPFVYVAGLYYLEAIDTSGCRSLQTVEIFGSTELPNITFTIPDIDCTRDTFYIKPDKKDGFLFSWKFPDNSMSNDMEPGIILPGEYMVTVTNELQPECQEIHNFQIRDVRNYPDIQVAKEELTCLKDSARVTITFGPGNHDWEIFGPSGVFLNESDVILHALGWHYIRAENEFGCITQDSFEIVLNDIHPVISILPLDTITCETPVVTATFESSLPTTLFKTYKNDTLLASGSMADFDDGGLYTVVGTSANACQDTLMFFIAMDTLRPDLSIEPFDTITCIRPEVSLLSSSNSNQVRLLWNDQDVNPFLVSSGGMYTASALNISNGCVTEKSVEVKENKIYATYGKLSDTISCKQKNVTIGIEPQSNYGSVIWDLSNPIFVSDGTLLFSSNQPGVYIFEVISQEQCRTLDSVVIRADTLAPRINTLNEPDINCFNPAVTLNVSIADPLDSIVWRNPLGELFFTSSFQSSIPGAYHVHLVGKNGCVTDSIVTVERRVNLPVFSAFTDSLSCKKGKGIIGIETTDTLFSISWSGPGNFISSLSETLITVAGTYRVVVTNVHGCKDSAEVIVPGDYITPVFLVKDTFFIPCDSSLISLQVESSDSIIQYYWEREGQPFSEEPFPMTNVEGLYTVWVTGINGCRSIQEFDVIQAHLPRDFSFTSDSISCLKPNAVLMANSPHSNAEYTWITPGGMVSYSPIFETNEAGYFSLIVKDENKCLDTVLVFVPIDTMPPDIKIFQDGIIACEQRTSTLAIPDTLQKSFYQYTWFGNPGQVLSATDQSFLFIQEPGSFSVSVTNTKNGCHSFTRIEVMEIPSSFNSIGYQLVQPPCDDFNFGALTIDTLYGIPPYQIKLNETSYENTREINLLHPGMYTLEVKDSIGCVFDTSFVINDATILKFPLPRDTILFLGDSLVLFTQATDSTWSNYTFFVLERGDTICSPCQWPLVLMPGQSTAYTIGANSIHYSCQILETLLVSVQEEILSGIPNVIHRQALNPANKSFYIPQTRGIKQILSMEIYDKWGNPLFARYNFPPGDPTFAWDGYYKGKIVETGVYVVICKIRLSNDRIISYQGDVTILD